MNELSLAQTFAVWVIPVLFAITVHEVAHGWVASRLGDPTARMLGRLTLNPIKHIDPVGTVIVPGFLLAMGGFIFGWAKPVPVNFRNLRNPVRDMALVALAGPLTNILMAIAWTVVFKIGAVMLDSGQSAALWLALMGQAGIMINLVLAVLNLLPIPPLDGSRVLESLLPPSFGPTFRSLENVGFFILLGLLYFGILGKIIMPAVMFMQYFLLSTAGLI